LQKVKNLPQLVDENTVLEDPNMATLLEKVLTAVAKKTEIEITSDGAAEKKTDKKPAAKKAEPEDDDASDDAPADEDDAAEEKTEDGAGDETGDEPAEETDKPTKTDKAKKASSRKAPPTTAKVGIIETITDCLRKKHCTKEQILARLVQKFPQRPADGMKRTVSIQVPTGLKTRKGLNVQKDAGGKYFIAEKTAE
jgi:hypothetical protein